MGAGITLGTASHMATHGWIRNQKIKATSTSNAQPLRREGARHARRPLPEAARLCLAYTWCPPHAAARCTVAPSLYSLLLHEHVTGGASATQGWHSTELSLSLCQCSTGASSSSSGMRRQYKARSALCYVGDTSPDWCMSRLPSAPGGNWRELGLRCQAGPDNRERALG